MGTNSSQQGALVSLRSGLPPARLPGHHFALGHADPAGLQMLNGLRRVCSFGALQRFQVSLGGIDAVMVLTLIILK